MASDRLDLSLSLRSSYVPETITNIFFDLANIDDASQKITILNVYLEKYIEELSRVERFKSELPQCMILLTDAIKVIKKEIKNIEMSLSEFRTQQRTCEQEQSKKFYKNYITQGKDLAESSSIPSRNHPLDYTTQSYKYNEHRKGKEINQSSILSLETHKANIPRIKTEDCSSINTDSDSTTWNNRRHWTPELHAKFEMALHMLGGPQVATPKQIRKIMNIEDLTNDQVKSHLQKYRLYSRRIVQGDANSAGHLTGFQYHWAPDIYYRGL